MNKEDLDAALASGRLSRMGYLLKRMRLAEQEADDIIRHTPQSQAARLAIQAEEMQQKPPPITPRRHHWQDN